MYRDSFFYNKRGRMKNDKFLDKIESYFNVYQYDDCVELETWTDCGVNMLITLDNDKNLSKQFMEYVEYYDYEEEIDFYRQIEDYRKQFTVTQSVSDLKKYDDFLMNCVADLKGLEI